MRIGPGAIYDRYRGRGTDRGPGAAGTAGQKPAEAGHTDRVALSGGTLRRGEFDRQLHQMSAEIEAAASPAVLAHLRTKIENDEYHVSSQDLANAMLGIALR